MFELVSRAPPGINALAFTALCVLPFLALSLSLVRWGRAYRWHRLLQTTTAAALLVALILFEWQVRLEGWRLYAEDSIYYDSWVTPALVFHLCFAAPTLGLWIVTLSGAWKNFPRPTKPGKYSIIHKRLGRLAAGSLVGTAISGWIFYYVAFVC